MEKTDFDIINKLNPHCFRKPGIPVVYIGTLKCGSTFYSTLLLDNGWDRIKFTDIDWDQDRVFGFINDPDVRFYKGFIEDIRNLAALDEKGAEDLESHILKTLQDFNQHLLIFSEHTIPVSVKLGKFVDKIDWIPVFDGFPHHEVFLKLLKTYGLTVEPGANLDPNEADEFKQAHYEKFSKIMNRESELYKIFTLGNRDLFNQVQNNINLDGNSWQEISWLKSKISV